MGGNLFKLGRLPREEYLKLEKEMRAYLDKRFGSEHYRIPRFYSSKPDFGDMDILLSSRALGHSSWEVVRKEIVETLGIEDHKTTGNVFSTAHKGLQTDFFITPHEFMVTKSNFMDFNDVGNFIGRLFLPFNLKYGEKGLFYVFRRGDGEKDNTYKREILVSTDWGKILTFVGLDYQKWVLGFDEMEEMFDWVLESPYFRSGTYLNPDSPIMKNRIKHRTTTQLFLQYLEKKRIYRNYACPKERDFQKRNIENIESFFPGCGLSAKVKDELRLEEEDNNIKTKFNGKLVMEMYPELQGKELGAFMREFQSDFPRKMLLELSAAEIEQAIRQQYQRTL